MYQSARPFDPYLIPLPIRMGRPGPGEVPPPAIGNTELLKVNIMIFISTNYTIGGYTPNYLILH